MEEAGREYKEAEKPLIPTCQDYLVQDIYQGINFTQGEGLLKGQTRTCTLLK